MGQNHKRAHDANKISIQIFGGMGDVLAITPALKALKQQEPNRKIVVHFVSEDHRRLLENNPHVDKYKQVLTAPSWLRDHPLLYTLFGLIQRRVERLTDPHRVRLSVGSMGTYAVYRIKAAHILAEGLEVDLVDDQLEIYLTHEELYNGKKLASTFTNPIIVNPTSRSRSNIVWPLGRWQQLIAHGYQLTKEFDWESCFVHDKRRVAVDLHRSITPHQFHFSLDFERLWTYRQPICIVGTTVSTMAPEDLLIVLCVQASKDTWEALSKPLKSRYDSLLKICDIAELLQVRPGMDWGRVLADTKRLGAQRMLFFGLRVASELLGTALPQELRSRVQAHSTISMLTAHIRAQLFDEADEIATTSLTPARFHFAIRERWQDKVFPYLHASALLTVPSEKDRLFLQLPGCLTFLYYVIRPLRAVREYGLRPFFQRLKRWLVWGSE